MIRYRQLDHDDAFYEKPETTLDRLDALSARASEVAEDIRKALISGMRNEERGLRKAD